MTANLSPAIRRALALAILAALLLLCFGGVVEPLLETYAAARASGAQMHGAIAHLESNGQSLLSLKAEAARLAAREQSTPGFLRGSNEALSGAELQNRVNQVAAAAHAELRSTLVLPAADEAKLRRIAVRSQIIANVGQLQQIFYQLESGSPLLFLDNVEIERQATPGPRGSTVQSSLDVRFDLYGYMRSGS